MYEPTNKPLELCNTTRQQATQPRNQKPRAAKCRKQTKCNYGNFKGQKMEIKQTKTADLIPYINNARTHSDKQVAQIAASIKEFGFVNPVLTDGDNGIIAGHGRVMAAKKLGLDTVPTIELSHLSGTQRKAYILADNRLAELSGWDDELLRLELTELESLDFDIDLIGFGDFDFSVETVDGFTDEDAVPAVPEQPVTKLGDVWILGSHRLMCGDSTSIDAVDKLMNGGKCDICFTSPPYNASVVITDGKHDKKYNNYDDNLSSNDYCDFLISFTNIAKTICEYCFINIQSLANNKLALIDYLYKNKNSFADYIIWDKCSAEPAMSHNVLNSQFEFIYVFSEKANRAIGTIDFRGTLSNIVSLPSRKDKEFSSIHKATFPVNFAEYFINNFAKKSVYDPFGGSGTTLIACEKTNRTNYSMELDEKYCDVIAGIHRQTGNA